MVDSPSSIVTRPHGIDHVSAAPPIDIPPGHVGEFVIPGTGRTVWWTGRVAIGLRHQPVRNADCEAATSQSALWIQRLMLASRSRTAHAV
jgi:hypothetical protein